MDSEPLVVGTGPVELLALHGWFGSATGWGPLPELLDGDRHTVAFVDHRGYGSRRGGTGDSTLAEIASDALATVDALGWSSSAVLGHSTGGSAVRAVPRPAVTAPGTGRWTR